jgi:hypothetical protein
MKMNAIRLGVLSLAILAFIIFATGVSAPKAEAENGTLQRPISDFLDAQILGEGNLSWISNPSQKDASYFCRVDFMGVINRYFLNPDGVDLGSEFSGTVTERVISDGRTEVHVVLHGRKVFFWVGRWPGFLPVLASRLAGAAKIGLSVDTCSSRYDLKYITPNPPGEPMPRLIPLLFNTPDDWEVLQSKLTAQGDCELRAAFGVPDGTPGRFTLNMNGLIHPKGGDVTQDETFPVANIMLRQVGN